jgi:hypothetical protein
MVPEEFLYGPLNLENESNMFLQNIKNYLPSNAASYPRRQEFSTTYQSTQHNITQDLHLH